MTSTQNHHQQLKNLLAEQRWDDAQALWLELAEQFPDQYEFLLLLVQDFADRNQAQLAAELASLITPNLKESGRNHEWLYALKLQAEALPTDKALRADLVEAYNRIHNSDPRLKTILQVAELEKPNSPMPAALTKADTLLALQIGSYCQHKSWGFGQVKSFDITLQRIAVSFPHNPDHAMQLAYAADSLTPLSREHIEVRKLTDLETLKRHAKDDPIALLRAVLLSYKRTATPAQIEAILSGPVISTDQWKKWWDKAKKLLKKDPHFEVPPKKTDPVLLRSAPVSQQDELLEAFRDASSLSQKTEIARRLIKVADEIENPKLLLQEFEDGLLESIKIAPSGKTAVRVEAACVIEQLRLQQRDPSEDATPLILQLAAAAKSLPVLLEDLSAPTQKRVVSLLKSSRPEQLVGFINGLPSKVLDEISDLLASEAEQIHLLIRNQTASAELLHWVGNNVASASATRNRGWLESMRSPELAAAILAALESAPGKPTKKLHDLLLQEESLLTELLSESEPDTIRDVARQILSSTAFEELDRRSLMARLVKEFPFVQEFLVSKSVKEQPLVVSKASFDRRKAELDEIIQKKIPQNSKEIGQARSYGDLRENFEYKAAKDMQRLLMRRRAELERLLAEAQPSDFSAVNPDSVQIGTTVTVADQASWTKSTYHILGAWDSDPERGIISYPAALAQALLNKRVGEIAEWSGETGKQLLRIEKIEVAPAEILNSL